MASQYTKPSQRYENDIQAHEFTRQIHMRGWHGEQSATQGQGTVASNHHLVVHRTDLVDQKSKEENIEPTHGA